MKRISVSILLLSMAAAAAFSQEARGIKVFISVDMEGIAGVANWEEVTSGGKDYEYFRKIMTRETNAAIEGALEAGATEILVRDSHASARNILPEMLNRNAKLLRDWSGGFMGMMEGIDETFDAVVFIGYHAKAGTPDAILEHTMKKDIMDVAINGISLPEAGINALIAGYYNVPVVFLSGDLAVCKQARELLGEIETVAVKGAIGNAALNMHPEAAREKIREGVKKALLNRKKCKPCKFTSPFTMVLRLKQEELVHGKSFYPGAERTGNWDLTYRNDDLLEVIRALRWML